MTTEVIRLSDNPSLKSVKEAAIAALRGGKLVVFPTETVYGIGALASSAEAVDRLVSAKGGVAEEELDEKGLGGSGFGIIPGEGVPPPVVPLACLGAEELAGIAGDIVFVEHSLCLGFFAFPCNNRGSLSGLTDWQASADW